jgi:aldose 1-epimerase
VEEQIKVYEIQNKSGVRARITNYGARIMSLFVPDMDGRPSDIVMGYDNPLSYLTSNEKYYGATIGRYGNRIARGEFELLGQKYHLTKNNGNNSLHGGPNGFHNVIWTVSLHEDDCLVLKYFSPDMEEGFPGNISVRVVYSLNEENELTIEYFASTDKTTVLNLTHHSFFNLSGDMNRTVNDHHMQIFADFYTPVDAELIPTGEIAEVRNTPFDFRSGNPIGSRLNEQNEQLLRGRGYDHNWVLDRTGSNPEVRLAAKVTEPGSGRIMEVYTNEPGIQFYGGNFLNESDIGKYGVPYRHRTAFCLETQHFPDSPNKEYFPSTVLNKGQDYYSVCIYKFSHS